MPDILTKLPQFLTELAGVLAADCLSTDAAVLRAYATEQGPVTSYQEPAAVIWAESVTDVQAVVKLASAYGVAVVAAAREPVFPVAHMPATAASC